MPCSSTFETLFGGPAAVRVSAPGRVNLIGEHTDYNGGYVLPTVIPQRTFVELARRGDDRVRAWSANVGARAYGEYRLGQERKGGGWLDYVQGTTWVLSAEGFAVGGADLRVESGVPLGSGLSSSAALLVALLRAFREANGLDIEDVALARLAKKAENDFVGAPVGIMDQMAVTLASDGQALFLDTRSMDYTLVRMPAGADLIVINSGVAHNHAKGDYRTRRAECEQAAARLGVPQLRDLSVEDLPRAMELPDPLGRRARHVITEDERVLAAVRVMRSGDLAALGDLFYASHDSMRDDYEVSIPEIDTLVELARGESEVFGARLTGGGFGGSVVMLANAGTSRSVAERIVARYGTRTGRTATILVPDGSGLEAS
jgi:galactokinase